MVCKGEIRKSVEEDLEAYFESMVVLAEEYAVSLKKREIKRTVGVFRRLVEYAHPDAFMKKIALATLKDSYTILNSIQIL